MKQPTGNPSTLFCEQVSTVTVLFEKWNDCERAVVMYALLKRLSFPTLKFLQFSIESNLTQNFGSQKNLNSIETNANDAKHLQKLVNTYKSFSIAELTQIADKDSILYESDLYLKDVDKNYNKKEDVLHDILNMIPLLKPGNDEAKKVYLSLIPLAVEDTVRQLVAAELVQQIFSYLLIHPAISNDDRRSLSHWLRHLEDHIQSSFSSGQRSFYILTNTNESPPESLNASFSSMNGNNNQNAWQAIAPPSNKPQPQQHYQPTQQLSNMTLSSLNSASSTSSSDWNLNVLHLPPAGSIPNPPPSSSQNSLGIVTIESNEADISVEDTHISFSKNGTEVLDFDDNSDEGGNCNTQVAYIGDHLHVPMFGNFDNPGLALKTRRSNSLTTPSTSSSKAAEKSARDNACYNSTENLSQFAQKPRSFSLSIETQRNSLQSSGSETRLDELKPNYLKFTTQSVGMSNIGQWLKSLRLHKYVGLFTNMVYEDMMQITEEFLQGLGVTKGASHKLSLCIDKLKGRYETLTAIEVNLLENKMAFSTAIEELANMVLTPMKPMDNSQSNDCVAGKFLHVLDTLSQMAIKREISSSHDEECVNGLLWILERAMHNEAFIAHTNQLKEGKFKLSKLKMQFLPKSHHSKGGSLNPGVNKPRWSSSKTRKPDSNSTKSASSDRIHRKNSCDTSPFPLITLQKQPSSLSILSTNNTQHYQPESDKFQSSTQRHQQLQNQTQYYSANSMACTPAAAPSATPSSNAQYKSASYPSFSSAVSSGVKTMHQQQPQQRPEQQPLPQPNQPYRHHRHSLNNLIVLSNPQKQQVTTFGKSKPSTGTLTLNNKPLRSTAQLSQSSSSSITTAKSTPQAQSISLKPLPFSLSQKSIANNNNNNNSNQLKEDSDSLGKKSSIKNSAAGDINSSLEFLCLQMTEQAIN